MEAPSGGQAVQPSAAETKKATRRWMKDTERQFKRLKADCAELVKRSETSSKEMLDRLKNNLEQAREATRLEEQKVEQQKLMINTLQQLLQLPFEMTEFGTGATGVPVHHPPEGPAIEELSGLLQSHLPQGLANGNNSEQPASANDDQFPDVHSSN